MRCVRVIAAWAMAAGFAVCAAQAGIATDPNGMPAWRGSKTFESSPARYLHVVVEYCVYGSAGFKKSFGVDFGPGKYVYAYQIYNDCADHPWPVPEERDYVRVLTVGLDGDELAANPGYVDLVGHQNPNNTSIAVTSAKFRFSSPTLNYGSKSDVLYFTSPYYPEWDYATVSGNLTAPTPPQTDTLPSPVPEPATLGFISLATLFSLAKTRRRR